MCIRDRVNTVSFVDGIKYYRSEKDYFAMQRESDRLCREYGLSVIENPQRGKSKHYGEWRAEQEGRPTYLSLIKADVDAAIRQSMTERQFFYHLRQMGYEVKVGKDITVRPYDRPHGRKLARNFGEGYSLENIRRRILALSLIHIFSKRTIRPHVAVTSVDTASEALAVSISEKACVDMLSLIHI